MQPKRDGLVKYHDVSADYLEKRRLKKSAGWILLWAMGVGAVISGDYYGWNFGLPVGGFWGLTIATTLMAGMYICLVYSIAELSAALPHAGGFYSFVRNALGPTAGYLCGLTDTIEYVLTPAAIVVGIGGYMNTLVVGNQADAPAWLHFVWWILAYGIFVGINLRGVELTLRIGLVIAAAAVGVLLFLFAATWYRGAFDIDLLFNIPPDPGQSARGLPKGWIGVFAALPFATWFFLAIEQLPLAAEEAHDAVRDIPRALIGATMTLLGLSLLTLVINTGVGGGALAMGKSEAPVADGFLAVLGTGVTSQLMMVIALTGMIASFHSVIYAYGRVLFSLSRAGYFPRWISVVNRHHAPQNALFVGTGMGLVCAVVIHFFKDRQVGAALLNMAVFGAVISYLLVIASYVSLRIRRPHLPRPYRSPLGIGGALVGGGLALAVLVACLLNPEFRSAVIGTGVFLLVGMGYYLLYSRHRLVAQAPEEEVALIRHAEEELRES